jgi:hypothetical protein
MVVVERARGCGGPGLFSRADRITIPRPTTLGMVISTPAKPMFGGA